MAGVRRLNHAVLYVNDVKRSAAFYVATLGFSVVHDMGSAAFLRADASPNDHDLGLFQVGTAPGAVRAQRAPGLYHLAWQVDAIDELVAIRARLVSANALVGESDHGVSKSLYATDPDGIEFEVMWAVPQHSWDGKVGIEPLHLDREAQQWAGVGTIHEINIPASS